VDVSGNLWITDFGLARMLSEAGLTMTGDLVGTLRYMSPEQALAKRVPVDHRSDIYSLGVTLYELLTLRPACDGKDRQEVLQQIAFEEPRPPRRVNKAIPVELDTIVRKAIDKNPAKRYARPRNWPMICAASWTINRSGPGSRRSGTGPASGLRDIRASWRLGSRV
jgi:serine/threonine protein kinase